MAGFRVRRRRGAQQLDVHDADLAKRAGRALVAADERIRVTADELGFAEAELGADATTQLSEALVAVRRHLSDAFRLNRLNHDAIPGTADEVRARYERIVELCEWAEDVLDEQTSALAERMRGRGVHPRSSPVCEPTSSVCALASRTPARPSTASPPAMRGRRSSTWRPTLRRPISCSDSPSTAWAWPSGGVRPGSASRRASRSRHPLNRYAERATLLDAVETFEVEALRAESTLAAIVEESRRDLAAALEEPRSRRVADMIGELQAALAALPPAGVNTDPFAHLSRLREARAALDAAIAAARERATDPIPPVDHVHHAIKDADRQLDVARDAITGHPGVDQRRRP